MLERDMITLDLLRERLRIFGHAEVLVNGNSMFPTLHDHETISIKWKNSFDEGDIVCFFRQQRFVIHRLMIKFRFQDQVFFLEKGDNQKKGSIINQKDIIGIFQDSRTKISNSHYKILFRFLLPIYCQLKQFQCSQYSIVQIIIQFLQMVFWKVLPAY